MVIRRGHLTYIPKLKSCTKNFFLKFYNFSYHTCIVTCFREAFLECFHVFTITVRTKTCHHQIRCIHLSRDWRIFSKIPVVLSMRHQLILTRMFCNNFNCCANAGALSLYVVSFLPHCTTYWNCLLTTYYHVKKYRNMAFPDWTNYISECPVIMNRISALMKFIEKNGVIFRKNYTHFSDISTDHDL